jgi:hypothetical protein
MTVAAGMKLRALRSSDCTSVLRQERPDRLNADDTINTRLPITPIRKLNANGAAACAIRDGAQSRPSRQP